MAILTILTAPHQVLSKPAREVRPDEFGPALAQLLSDMAETMYAAPGVGLAAPQVGDGRRIVTVDHADREHRGRDLRKMVNPQILETSTEKIVWNETCLSVPELEVEVERHKRVRATWLNENAVRHEEWFEDYPAVIVQHELDHLLGTVLLDRVSAFRRSRYLKQRKKVMQREPLMAR